MRDVAEICAAIDAEKPVTREEAEAVVRAIEKKCMGPLKSMSERSIRGLLRRLSEDTSFPPDERKAAVAVVEAAAKQGADAAGIIAALRGEGLVSAAQVANALFRAGCGQDVNDLILAGPLDGEEHRYTCPACGVEASYRAPFIQTSD